MSGKKAYGVLKEEYFLLVRRISSTDADRIATKMSGILFQIQPYEGVPDHLLCMDGRYYQKRWVDVYELSYPPTTCELEVLEMLGYKIQELKNESKA